MKKQPLYLATLLAVFALPVSAWAQEQTLERQALSQTVSVAPRTLDDYRSLALKHNKSLQVAKMAVTKAEEEHRMARTNYLPKVSAVGAYLHTGDNLSLLSTDQQASLSTLGTQLMQGVTPEFMQAAQGFLAKHPDLFPLLQKGMAAGKQAEADLNAMGSNLVDKLTPDTRNVAVGAVMFTQPLYMGGKIRAYDRLTSYSTQLAGEKVRQAEQELIYDVDKAYWQVVSLHHKHQLAVEYRDLLRRLNADVEKMVQEGVATKANALAVAVELNKADITLLRVEDGETLSRMLLAQICGLPLNSALELKDLESVPEINYATKDHHSADEAVAMALTQRPELKQLALGQKIYEEKVKIDRAAFLPTLALTGGYGMTYPSAFNGFEKKFKGTWSVGLLLKVPLWEWGEGKHKVRAAKADVAMTALKAQEAQEKITLQVTQSHLVLNEAQKKLSLSRRNLSKAEENLRMARVGFDEGVITTSDLLAAQTAWMAAKTDVVDAQIDLQLANAALQKAISN